MQIMLSRTDNVIKIGEEYLRIDSLKDYEIPSGIEYILYDEKDDRAVIHWIEANIPHIYISGDQARILLGSCVAQFKNTQAKIEIEHQENVRKAALAAAEERTKIEADRIAGVKELFKPIEDRLSKLEASREQL